MLIGFKYKIYPTELQKELISKHIGCSRFIYNLALQINITTYAESARKLSAFDLINQLPNIKKQYSWLNNVSAQSLQQSILNMNVALKRFFKDAGFPKYKSKHKSKQSFTVPQKVKIKDNCLIIPKFREGIEIVLHRPINGIIKQATISITPTGKYFASILCETGEACKPKSDISFDNAIGIDLGIKSFAVTSNGEKFDNPKYLRKALAKLKYVQRKYSKNKGKRTKHKLALIHEKVANQRKDFLHKTSTKLIRENQTICLEDLNVKGMMKNHSLAQSISDVGWGIFVEFITYKGEWYGNNILKIGRFAPSSKTCSCCGYINKELTLKDREWACPKCSSVLDRDDNASTNIKNFAFKKHLSGEHTLKNHDELPTLVGVLTHEAFPVMDG